jgi:hypothetical protein
VMGKGGGTGERRGEDGVTGSGGGTVGKESDKGETKSKKSTAYSNGTSNRIPIMISLTLRVITKEDTLDRLCR